MNIQINGRQIDLPMTINSVNKLLGHYDLQSRIAIVEVNKEIVLKKDYENKTLSNGDVVEIIHFVGGG